jgi:hypothetical protein
MNKAQKLSQEKLPTVPVRVLRTFARREWSNFRKRENNGEWSFRSTNRKLDHGFEADLGGREILDFFLDVRGVDDALSFFHRTGYFYALSGEWSQDGIPCVPHVMATFSGVLRCQEMIKELVSAPLEKWEAIGRKYPVMFAPFRMAPQMFLHRDVESGAALAIVRCNTGLSAIAATIQVDKLAGLENRFCERTDCARLYKVESLHPRKFCSHECAHIQAVRNSRARGNRA